MSGFGTRFHPVPQVEKLHTGLDIGVDCGTPVRAALDVAVEIAEENDAYGLRVLLWHGTRDVAGAQVWEHWLNIPSLP